MEVPLARRVSPWSHRTHRAERLGMAFEDADAAEVGCSGGIACGDWGSPRLGHPRCGLDPVRRAVGERFTTAPVGAGGWQLLGSQQGGHRLLGQRLRDGLGQQPGPEVQLHRDLPVEVRDPRHRQRPVPDGSAQRRRDRLRGQRLRRRQARQPGPEVQLGRDVRDRVGRPGTGNGQFNAPPDIAVDRPPATSTSPTQATTGSRSSTRRGNFT